VNKFIAIAVEFATAGWLGRTKRLGGNLSSKNVYLDQVVEQKVQLEQDLKRGRVKRRSSFGGAAPAAAPLAPQESAGGAIDVRITGWWRWRNVIVPPNAYVVHSRRGHSKPVHIGLGVSFRFDPVTDAFLVVPAAMQTIVIQANSICKERQGFLVQAYVQWIIDDFETAYRKLDFSDTEDPMKIVNVQLREQAEAAIKDKVATMSIDEVLADKQPIIEELTARLRAVAEGAGDADKGLGLRIVTVQIKEAVVCSPRVWEMLQRPFRAERDREARLVELENASVVAAREAEAQQEKARLRIQADAERAKLELDTESERLDRERTERVRRAKLEAEAREETLAHERAKLAHDAELQRLAVQNELETAELRVQSESRREEHRIATEAQRRVVENDRSPQAIRMALIEALPQLADALPDLSELRSLSVGDASVQSALTGLLDAVRPLSHTNGAARTIEPPSNSED